MIIKDYYVNQIQDAYIHSDRFYFDIETLGLSAKIHPIILICAAYYNSDTTVLIRQYFCENITDEKQMLLAFLDDINGKSYCVNFNGNSFDLPFLRKRLEYHLILNNCDNIISRDLLVFVRPLKKFWKIENLKLKTIERFFNINRVDAISGQDSVVLYYDYQQNKSLSILNKILLHNYEDVKNLILLNSLILKSLLKQSISIDTKFGVINVYIYDYKIKKSKIKILFNFIYNTNINLDYPISIFKDNGDKLVQNLSTFEMDVFFNTGIDNANRKILYLELESKLLPLFINGDLINKNVFYLLRSFFIE